ncbi:UDP-N-acetylmuramoyl-tripeptide--D-alanyl-D-alanine ligase [Virgibacillus sp. W0430]|uniref:UDP-N-acetylmuramoyl-tripeptide--D-alanyl-D- alanine ligase n=1 Tax=Virgibacillus sp. W0430 TaxID=3391580 RepID=UPI003F48D251
MLFELKWLAEQFPVHRGNVEQSISIEQVTTDSRNHSTNALFIPLTGESFDGHHYIKQAIEKGSIAALWDEDNQLPDFLPEDFPIFFTSNTLEALQLLATAYRSEIEPTVIGITGSNGKTTTKDIVSTVVKTTYKTHATEGNLNNHIGLPLTILAMPRSTEVLILEMGMNHFGEIELLSKIAKPDIAVITNIGESHIEHLGSREGIAKAKLEITSGLKKNGCLIIDGDEPLLSEIRTMKEQIRCGFTSANDIRIEDVVVDLEGTTFQITRENKFTTPLLGQHHAKNCAYAIAVAKKLSIHMNKVKQAISALKITNMRFEQLKGRNGSTIINDAYNASPTSMIASIEVIKQMSRFKHKILVLGDIYELGDFSETLHQSIAPHIDNQITALFTYGKESETITKAVEQENTISTCAHFHSINKLINALEPLLTTDTIVLFKASRGMQFEKIINKVL